jgi:hypothetical protein
MLNERGQPVHRDAKRSIIANGPPALAAARPAFHAVLALALLIGAAGVVHYARLGLTMSHYDARAHLVVARRVIDSLTPGWRQLGGVWLPLPHLIAMLPVQNDWAYRTGYVGAAFSAAVLAWGLAALASLVMRRTRSWAAALTGPLLVLLNPNVLYLQSTPMTEPLLFALSCLSVVAVDAWIESPGPREARRAGWMLALLVLTRYEGWCIAGALVVIAAAVSRPRMAGVLSLAWRPVVAILLFLVLSRTSTGAWFVSSGFFVPDNPSRHHPLLVLHEVVSATVALGGPALVLAGVAGAVALAVHWRRSASIVALAAACALPIAAFYAGHPHRVRYMVPLVVAAGALSSFAIAALPGRVRALTALALVAFTLYVRPPFDRSAPMVVEAQWETPFRLGREAVSQYLDATYDHTPILASMGSLGHYMQETSSHGLRIADFLHEGNGDLWSAALREPRMYVHWILIEERAEGGDLLAARARSDPHFLDGFARAAEGGGLALYRREP